MIYESQIQELLSKWREAPSTSVNDCINDVETLIDKNYQDEAAMFALMPPEEVQSYLDDLDADYYINEQKELNEIWY